MKVQICALLVLDRHTYLYCYTNIFEFKIISFPFSVGHYAEDRKPTTEEKEDILRLKGLGVSSGKIALHLLKETGKIFKRKDIDHISEK